MSFSKYNAYKENEEDVFKHFDTVLGYTRLTGVILKYVKKIRILETLRNSKCPSNLSICYWETVGIA